MGKVTAKLNVSNLEDVNQLGRYTSIALGDIGNQLNGNINLSNLSATVVPFSFSKANTVYGVPHGLGRIPAIWMPGSIDANAVVYQSKASDNVNLYLEASATCNAKIFVI